ncbi:hypothetical protein QYF61_013610 [Mycteria americana]|uniref:Uncharacterized protein n=1 Tax=Mycteria americana TaxID=33587 RepID=A0AAN7S7H4_MYCAM|nr:hypothetical protein QYF61_013610 [Mycteria americana]
MLAGLDPLVILYVPCDGTQDDLLHQLPWYRGQADRPVVPRVLLISRSKNYLKYLDKKFKVMWLKAGLHTQNGAQRVRPQQGWLLGTIGDLARLRREEELCELIHVSGGEFHQGISKGQNHGIIESFRLEQTFKITKSNH